VSCSVFLSSSRTFIALCLLRRAGESAMKVMLVSESRAPLASMLCALLLPLDVIHVARLALDLPSPGKYPYPIGTASWLCLSTRSCMELSASIGMSTHTTYTPLEIPLFQHVSSAFWYTSPHEYAF
jgi:hypothetical protein